MTTTDTKKVDATVEQVMKCADAGADLVRITVQGGREAEACMHIREKLFKYGYDTPLVADIHFNPKVALRVCDAFEKIRVNPGNFADGIKKFDDMVYESQAQYDAEVEQMEEMFTPLVEKCKKLGRAIRIGTNHGSLSARILSYYGDTPGGMVESAFEFARVCRKNDFHNFLFSMKASNPLVMVQAYRLLASEMYRQDWNYPLHLGVTEAGEGEDGRMKSAIGIGALLLDGLGDTIRVSLTEDPEFEMEPCSRLALLGTEASDLQIGTDPFVESSRDFKTFDKRKGILPVPVEEESPYDVGKCLHRDGSVLSVVDLARFDDPDKLYSDLGTKSILGLPFKDIATSDSIILRDLPEPTDAAKMIAIKRLQEGEVGIFAPLSELRKNAIKGAVALVTMDEFAKEGNADPAQFLPEGIENFALTLSGEEAEEDIAKLAAVDPVCLILKVDQDKSRVHVSRKFFDTLARHNIANAVIHHLVLSGGEKDDIIITGGSECGAVLVDGLGDGVIIESDDHADEFLRLTSFGMLQGCRMRSTKTDYVSCPSCGRTLFDLQEVTASIQEKTGHLPGVSIAIMGCIVNGPGEMADADFGYVGTVPGKIDLYVGREVVRKGIKMDSAVDELIELIKEHDMWVEKEEEEQVASV
jgi:(E)-4-hydroxy-3-methylbut-2-enyl-diphosphate synthase